MENNKKTINIDDLRLVIDKIFCHIINDLETNEIDLERDFYWQMCDKEIYITNKTPSDFTMGSLIDDWEFLQSLLTNDDQAVSLMFMHVYPLLRYLSLRSEYGNNEICDF